MKSIKNLSKRIIGILTGVIMLIALSVPAFAASSSFTVKAVDENSKPLAGVVFRMIGTDDSKGTDFGPVTTGEDGTATFNNLPKSGTFELTEVGAPDGYVCHDVIQSITIIDNEVFYYLGNELAPYSNDNPIIFENSPSEMLTVSVPVIIKTKQTGEKSPGKASFKVKMFTLSEDPNLEEIAFIKILNDRIETNGVGEFNGVLKFAIPKSCTGYINDGFILKEINEGADGWTYSEAKYNVIPRSVETDPNGIADFEIRLSTVEDGQPVYSEPIDNATFENSYNKANDPVAPTEPSDGKNNGAEKNGGEIAKSPKTGDRSILICSAMLLAGICLAGTSVILKIKNV